MAAELKKARIVVAGTAASGRADVSMSVSCAARLFDLRMLDVGKLTPIRHGQMWLAERGAHCLSLLAARATPDRGPFRA